MNNGAVMSKSVEKYQITFIRARHRELARLLTLGYTLTDACNELDMSVSRASIIQNSPAFIKEMERMASLRDTGLADVQRELDTELNSMQGLFNGVCHQSMVSDDPEVAIKGATLWAKATGKITNSRNVAINFNQGISPVDLSKYLTAPTDIPNGNTTIDITEYCKVEEEK
jgi:hypothetical protein